MNKTFAYNKQCSKFNIFENLIIFPLGPVGRVLGHVLLYEMNVSILYGHIRFWACPLG